MAEATIRTKMLAVKTVALELTEKEAAALTDVLGMVGGSPEDSRRRHTQAIYDALRDGGFRSGAADINGMMMFEDEK